MNECSEFGLLETMLSSSSSSTSTSSSSWTSSSWSLGLGLGLQRKASGWLASSSGASSGSGPQSSRPPSIGNSDADADAASIASSSLSLSSSRDSAILLDLADSLDSSTSTSSSLSSSSDLHLFKGSPLVADPIASDDDDVLPLVHQPPSSSSSSSFDSPASASSWRSFAQSALSSARVRLGSVSSIAPVAAAAAESVAAPSTLTVNANVTHSPPPPPATTTKSAPPARDDPAPTEYRLPWLGIGLPSPSRRALRATILALSHSRSTFTEPLNPDFPYSSSLYSPLVTLLLAEDTNLATMRAKLVPRTLADRDFWHNYLYRVSLAVTHAKLDAGVGGALLPLIRSCSGPMLVATTSTAGVVGRPRANTVRSEHGEQCAAGDPIVEARSAGRGGLVGMAAAGDVDPMFVPLPEDEHGDEGQGDSSLVIHDNFAATLSLDSDLATILLTGSPTLSLTSDWSHLDDDDTYLTQDDDTGAKPDDMDRMLEYDTDAFYVLLQDMALSAPLPVVHVPDTLPESGPPRRRPAEVGDDGMMVVSLE